MTSGTPPMDPAIREHLMSKPDILLDDPDFMRALVGARDAALGANVIDLRGVAMQRLADRLDRLEDTHRTVVAAAYDNIAGIAVIHRAVLGILDPTDAAAFWALLDGQLAELLRVDALRLLIETDGPAEGSATATSVGLADRGYCSLYAGPGRGGAPRRVTLRRIDAGDAQMHGPDWAAMRSEACLLLDLGPGAAPGMLVLGTRCADQLAPGQGVDLLDFFAGAFERVLRRWLA